VAGILIAPITTTSYDVGVMLGLKGFAAAILGGLGSGLGAVIGGLVLGIAETMSAGYLSSAYKDAIAFVIILAVLFFMPSGLFGKRGGERFRRMLARRMLQGLASPRSGGLLALAAAIALLPLVLSNKYFYDIAILVGLNAIVCVGLNLLIGYAGQISLGHAVSSPGRLWFGHSRSRFGWPPLAAMLTTTAAVAALAFLVGRPILRLKGHYLAMATLGLGIIIFMVITTEDKYTGGPDGISVVPFSLGAYVLQGERVWYWVVGVLLCSPCGSRSSDRIPGRAGAARAAQFEVGAEVSESTRRSTR